MGLPLEARFHPLFNSTEHVVEGKRRPLGGTRLVGWGKWFGGPK